MVLPLCVCAYKRILQGEFYIVKVAGNSMFIKMQLHDTSKTKHYTN